ncbi:MAG: hypothetical protein DMD58_06070 [Gemmatimonadetes bacterium]|nr:MAG: hypothetical protein DMD58_06070 [Gemmatimonadota bacterium]
MRALGVTRALGVARALLAFGLDDAPVSMHLVGYSPGERATLEVRVGKRSLAVKAYAEDPTRATLVVLLTAMLDLSADCLHPDIRTGYVQATITRASQLRPDLVSVDLKVLGGLGAFVANPKRKALEVDLDQVSFSLGPHKSVTLRCEKSLCAKLLGVDNVPQQPISLP